MKTALIKVMLKYDFADDVSIQGVIDEVNNMELPKEYEEDSFEWFGIRLNEGTDEEDTQQGNQEKDYYWEEPINKA